MPGPPAITFRTTDLTRWGTGKGSNLLNTEADINLWNILQAIVALQTTPLQPNNIASITVSGIYMTVTLTDGSTIGPLAMPVLQFKWRGAWQPLTAYNQLDVFQVATVGLFSVLQDHTSQATFNPAYSIGGLPVYNELFGFSGASGVALADLTDVGFATLTGEDRLTFDAGSSKWINTRPDYVLGAFAPGLMGANQSLLYHTFPVGVTIPANFADYRALSTKAGGSANASADVLITVSKALAASPNVFSVVGSITIGSGGTVITAASTSGGVDLPFVKGDVLRLGGPVSPDATFADFNVTIAAHWT